MKLTDLIYRVGHRYREVENFIRHPMQIIEQRGRRVFQEKLEGVELPLDQRSSKTSERQDTRSQSQLQPETSPMETVADRPSNQFFELNPGRVSVVERPVSLAEMPLLSEREEIRGRWGRYRRVGEVLQVQRQMRLYNGVLVLNEKPILIKEYLLPERVFNHREVRERKEAFALLTGLNLRTSDGQDFRIVTPWDAIAPTDPAERRCYLITEPINNSLALRDYLTTNPDSIPAKQVRQMLSQILQSLWFLHNQRVRLPSGEVLQGLAHGNLSLDSLLIVENPAFAAGESQFLIYVANLTLWEQLFEPANQTLNPTLAQDLIDLGQIGWQLLTGTSASEFASDRSHQRLLSPNGSTLAKQTPDQSADLSDDPALQQYIKCLIRGDFKNDAEAARRALLQLPLEQQLHPTIADSQPDTDKSADVRHPVNKLRLLLLLGLLGGCLGGLLWLSWHWAKQSPGIWLNPCCLAKLPNIPATQLTYVAQTGGIWSDSLRRQSAVSYGKTLEQELKSRDSRLNGYTLKLTDDVIREVQSGRAEFGLTEWRDRLPSNLVQQEVAFDGLAVVVAFSDVKRSQNIPETLNGKISFDQLRQLYTGNSDWNLPTNLKDWKIKLYMPNDTTATALFKQRVLKGDPFKPGVTQTSENIMLGEILRDFEMEKRLGIGFVRLSKVFEQCSVYPLAIAEKDQAVQAFVQDNGKSIDPAVDLCNDKGSYWLNPRVFNSSHNPLQRSYALTYRLVVVYRKGSKAGEGFVAALKTDEGQSLLSATGLVPLKPLLKP